MWQYAGGLYITKTCDYNDNCVDEYAYYMYLNVHERPKRKPILIQSGGRFVPDYAPFYRRLDQIRPLSCPSSRRVTDFRKRYNQ